MPAGLHHCGNIAGRLAAPRLLCSACFQPWLCARVPPVVHVPPQVFTNTVAYISSWLHLLHQSAPLGAPRHSLLPLTEPTGGTWVKYPPAHCFVVPRPCRWLQVRWWRLVVDEAQLVGPLSASGAMVEKMQAVHRWVGGGVGWYRCRRRAIQFQGWCGVLAWWLAVQHAARSGGAMPAPCDLGLCLARLVVQRSTAGWVLPCLC